MCKIINKLVSLRKTVTMLLILLAIISISYCCEQRSALNKVNVYVAETRYNAGRKINDANFHLLDNFEIIDVIDANVPELCESMVKNFPRLQQLSLVNINLTRIHMGAFQQLPRLTHLSLSVNNLTSLIRGSFQNLANLKVLYLSNNKIEDIEIGTFDNLPVLKKIYLDRNKIMEINGHWFLKSPELSLIDLSFNSISRLQKKAFRIHLPNTVVEIRLQFNIIEVVDPKPVYAVEVDEYYDQKPYLILHLEHNRIDTVSVEVVGSFHTTNCHLIFNNNNIKCIDNQVIEVLKMNELSLHIANNPLTCDCMRKLKKVAEDPMRSTLYFNSTIDPSNCFMEESWNRNKPNWIYTYVKG